jgi:hypothetical protein
LKQKEEERQRQAERRKKERQKAVNKKRNLETLVKDAKKRAEDFERQVVITSVMYLKNWMFAFSLF